MAAALMLYEHQIAGAAWLAARPTGRGYLGDTAGLGKTRTLIAALNSACASQPLIICPAIVRTHWQREFDTCRWGRPVLVKSYDEVVRGGVPLMKDLMWNGKIDALVLDEAHFLKSLDSKRSKILLGKNGYARRLAHVFAGSGTPVPKNPSEFWTILASIFPEVAVEHGLKTFEEFVARFCISRGSYVRGAWREKILPTVQNPEEFRAILSKVMLRRTLDDVGLDVPLLDWQTVRLDIDVDEFGDYDADAASAAGHIRAAIDADSLESIANDPHIARMRRRLGELKVKPTIELLTSQLADSDERVVVLAYHRDVLHGLESGLAKFGVAYIDGDTPPAQRAARIDRFQTDPACRVFLGQITACQTGITLTAARRVVIVEPSWTAVENVQAGHRVARIGQQASRCVVQLICLSDTLDEAVVGQHLKEVRMTESIFNASHKEGAL